jgi:hypothetical protein
VIVHVRLTTVTDVSITISVTVQGVAVSITLTVDADDLVVVSTVHGPATDDGGNAVVEELDVAENTPLVCSDEVTGVEDVEAVAVGLVVASLNVTLADVHKVRGLNKIGNTAVEEGSELRHLPGIASGRTASTVVSTDFDATGTHLDGSTVVAERGSQDGTGLDANLTEGLDNVLEEGTGFFEVAVSGARAPGSPVGEHAILLDTSELVSALNASGSGLTELSAEQVGHSDVGEGHVEGGTTKGEGRGLAGTVDTEVLLKTELLETSVVTTVASLHSDLAVAHLDGNVTSEGGRGGAVIVLASTRSSAEVAVPAVTAVILVSARSVFTPVGVLGVDGVLEEVRHGLVVGNLAAVHPVLVVVGTTIVALNLTVPVGLVLGGDTLDVGSEKVAVDATRTTTVVQLDVNADARVSGDNVVVGVLEELGRHDVGTAVGEALGALTLAKSGGRNARTEGGLNSTGGSSVVVIEGLPVEGLGLDISEEVGGTVNVVGLNLFEVLVPGKSTATPRMGRRRTVDAGDTRETVVLKVSVRSVGGSRGLVDDVSVVGVEVTLEGVIRALGLLGLATVTRVTVTVNEVSGDQTRVSISDRGTLVEAVTRPAELVGGVGEDLAKEVGAVAIVNLIVLETVLERPVATITSGVTVGDIDVESSGGLLIGPAGSEVITEHVGTVVAVEGSAGLSVAAPVLLEELTSTLRDEVGRSKVSAGLGVDEVALEALTTEVGRGDNLTSTDTDGTGVLTIASGRASAPLSPLSDNTVNGLLTTSEGARVDGGTATGLIKILLLTDGPGNLERVLSLNARGREVLVGAEEESITVGGLAAVSGARNEISKAGDALETGREEPLGGDVSVSDLNNNTETITIDLVHGGEAEPVLNKRKVAVTAEGGGGENSTSTDSGLSIVVEVRAVIAESTVAPGGPLGEDAVLGRTSVHVGEDGHLGGKSLVTKDEVKPGDNVGGESRGGAGAPLEVVVIVSGVLVLVGDVRVTESTEDGVVTEPVVGTTTVELGRLTTVGDVTVEVVAELSLASTVEGVGEVPRGVQVVKGGITGEDLIKRTGTISGRNTGGGSRRSVELSRIRVGVLVGRVSVVGKESTGKDGTVIASVGTALNVGTELTSDEDVANLVTAVTSNLGLTTVTRVTIAINVVIHALENALTSEVGSGVTITIGRDDETELRNSVASNPGDVTTVDGRTKELGVLNRVSGLTTVGPVTILITAKVRVADEIVSTAETTVGDSGLESGGDVSALNGGDVGVAHEIGVTRDGEALGISSTGDETGEGSTVNANSLTTNEAGVLREDTLLEVIPVTTAVVNGDVVASGTTDGGIGLTTISGVVVTVSEVSGASEVTLTLGVTEVLVGLVGKSGVEVVVNGTTEGKEGVGGVSNGSLEDQTVELVTVGDRKSGVDEVAGVDTITNSGGTLGALTGEGTVRVAEVGVTGLATIGLVLVTVSSRRGAVSTTTADTPRGRSETRGGADTVRNGADEGVETEASTLSSNTSGESVGVNVGKSSTTIGAVTVGTVKGDGATINTEVSGSTGESAVNLTTIGGVTVTVNETGSASVLGLEVADTSTASGASGASVSVDVGVHGVIGTVVGARTASGGSTTVGVAVNPGLVGEETGIAREGEGSTVAILDDASTTSTDGVTVEGGTVTGHTSGGLSRGGNSETVTAGGVGGKVSLATPVESGDVTGEVSTKSGEEISVVTGVDLKTVLETRDASVGLTTNNTESTEVVAGISIIDNASGGLDRETDLAVDEASTAVVGSGEIDLTTVSLVTVTVSKTGDTTVDGVSGGLVVAAGTGVASGLNDVGRSAHVVALTTVVDIDVGVGTASVGATSLVEGVNAALVNGGSVGANTNTGIALDETVGVGVVTGVAASTTVVGGAEDVDLTTIKEGVVVTVLETGGGVANRVTDTSGTGGGGQKTNTLSSVARGVAGTAVSAVSLDVGAAKRTGARESTSRTIVLTETVDASTGRDVGVTSLKTVVTADTTVLVGGREISLATGLGGIAVTPAVEAEALSETTRTVSSANAAVGVESRRGRIISDGAIATADTAVGAGSSGGLATISGVTVTVGIAKSTGSGDVADVVTSVVGILNTTGVGSITVSDGELSTVVAAGATVLGVVLGGLATRDVVKTVLEGVIDTGDHTAVVLTSVRGDSLVVDITASLRTAEEGVGDDVGADITGATLIVLGPNPITGVVDSEEVGGGGDGDLVVLLLANLDLHVELASHTEGGLVTIREGGHGDRSGSHDSANHNVGSEGAALTEDGHEGKEDSSGKLKARETSSTNDTGGRGPITGGGRTSGGTGGSTGGGGASGGRHVPLDNDDGVGISNNRSTIRLTLKEVHVHRGVSVSLISGDKEHSSGVTHKGSGINVKVASVRVEEFRNGIGRHSLALSVGSGEKKAKYA